MSYCINPRCHTRTNAETADHCQSCGTPLWIEGRYRIVRSLLPDEHPYTEVFEVCDRQEPDIPKVLKTLKSDNTQILSLFQQEQAILLRLQHAGIPKGKATFTLPLPQGAQLQGLVMEHIDGMNLEQWLHRHGPISEAQALDWLAQLTTILKAVHGDNFFHRDIKPSNIMRRSTGNLVLIDFGTARYYSETLVNGHSATVVVSYGYTAPEQLQGYPVQQSDFYALGRTFIHLLTGIHPREATAFAQQWTQTKAKLSKPLVTLLDRLVALDATQRPRHAQAILQAVGHIVKPPPPWQWWLVPILGAGMLGWWLGRNGVMEWAIAQVIPPPACTVQIGDHLSCGEEILTPNVALPEKRAGVKAWRAGKYSEALGWFNKSLALRKNDPETLIYRNNALIVTRGLRQSKTIGVVVPLNAPDETSSSGLEMLRGIAQAQDEALQRNIPIKILIGDDANAPEQAQEVAIAFVQRREIIAVIGHYASEVTLAVIQTYQAGQLVMLASTSTSTNLSSWGNRPGHVFFRTVPTTQQSAQKLMGYLTTTAPQQSVAVFYNHQSDFSRSLREQFVLSFPDKQRVVERPEFDLARDPFNPAAVLKMADQLGAKAIAVFPDGHTHPYAFQNALNLIRTSQNQRPILTGDGPDNQEALRRLILGGNTLYDSETLNTLGALSLRRLVISVPWHSTENPIFAAAARAYWQGDVNWRTATSYDAAQVLITAFAQNPQNRTAVQKILADPTFVTPKEKTATGEIRFLRGDRAEAIATLVKVVPRCGRSDYAFVPATDAAPCAGLSAR
jgi:eukaryotic-like serine/threonine-protein kinase